MFGSVRVGASRLLVGDPDLEHARRELRAVGEEHATTWRQLQFAVSLQERLLGIGVLNGEDAERLGAVGPAARAAGVRHDVRSESPRLWYGEFRPVAAPDATGDVAARMAQRSVELEQSFALLDELLARPLPHGQARPVADATTFGIGRVESPRGTTVCLVERDGQRLQALHLRTGSYANWPALAVAVTGDLLPDFPLINKSFELCYACVDR